MININRDLNIVGKYRQAQELFEQGDHEQTALLLRNIKAFDPGLEEKVIALRRKAQQQENFGERFQKAVNLFEKKWYGEARKAFLKLQKTNQNDEQTNNYIKRIDNIKKDQIDEVVKNLGENNFQLAQEKFNKMSAIFPDAEEEQGGCAEKEKTEVNIDGNGKFNNDRDAEKK
ncbi:MAG: hypothetical protein D3910_08330 [Candidatus Electrothrix sp. ATG2]|nr:hypothetical protein [Candidatus Electrothrix sp. ATG2]